MDSKPIGAGITPIPSELKTGALKKQEASTSAHETAPSVAEDSVDIKTGAPPKAKKKRKKRPATPQQEKFPSVSKEETSHEILISTLPQKGLDIDLVNNRTNNPTTIAMLDEAQAAQEESPAPSPEAALISRIREEFSEYPEMAAVLEQYVADTSHPMNIVAYLKNPESRDYVMAELKEMAALRKLPEDQFGKVIDATFDPSKPLMMANDFDYNFEDDQDNMAILKEELLFFDEPLFSIGDNPTQEQRQELDEYADRLMYETTPELVDRLEEIVADIPAGDGFPAINARAKTAGGMLDKIKRVRSGNEWKAPRPDYCLADMPDAVGGRITVKTPEQLEQVMHKLEETFGGEDIYEKDSFYANSKKKYHPYRVITYTVTIDEVPCEIQVTTLRSSLAADLWHNTGYKPIHEDFANDPEMLEYLSGMQRAVSAQEHVLISGH